jgi:hypothetical protein
MKSSRSRATPRNALQIAAELMSLTKMNVNNADVSDATPITLEFAERVSEVLKRVGPEMPVRSEYAFYMCVIR